MQVEQDMTGTLRKESRGHEPVVGVQVQWASGGGRVENNTAQALRSGAEHNYQFARTGMQVRRLTPAECERLQGFPDGYTLIDVASRKKLTQVEYAYIRKSRPEITAAEACRLAKDGPRYKALGNSMAVNVMSWIGQRIQMCDEVLREHSPASPPQRDQRAILTTPARHPAEQQK